MKRKDLKQICTKLKEAMGDNRYQEGYISKNKAPKALRKLTLILKEQPPRSPFISKDIEDKVIRAICKSFYSLDIDTICQFVETEWLTKEKLLEALQAYQNELLENPSELTIASSYFGKLILVNASLPSGNPDFDSLIGRAKNVYICLEEDKHDLFCEAIQFLNWFENPIFQDPTVLYIALGACLKGKITSTQYATLSQWIELKKRYNADLVKIYPLLDEEDDITSDSGDHLFIHLLSKFPRENIKQFIENLKGLPFTERVLIKIPASRFDSDDVSQAFDAGGGVLLFGNSKDKAYTALSTGAYETLMEANYGDNFYQIKPQLGLVSINDIEQSMRNKTRVMSTYYPHPKGTICDNPRFFHKVPTKTTTLIGYHDMWHTYAASSTPKELHPSLFHFVDTVRAYTDKKWSSGLWDIIDYNYTAVCFKDWQSTSMMLLIAVAAGFQHSLKKGKFSPEMGVLILDTYFFPEKWTSYGINSGDVHHTLYNRPNVMKNLTNLTYYSIHEWIDYFSPSDPKQFSLFKLAIIFECCRAKIQPEKLSDLLSAIQEKQETILPLITIGNRINHNYTYSPSSNRKMQEMRLCFKEKAFGESNQQDDENLIKYICEQLDISELLSNKDNWFSGSSS